MDVQFQVGYVIGMVTTRPPVYAGSAAFHEAKRAARQFPVRQESKAQRVARKQWESIPLERAERRRNNLGAYEKSAERMGYDQPVNKQAVNEINFKRRPFKRGSLV